MIKRDDLDLFYDKLIFHKCKSDYIQIIGKHTCLEYLEFYSNKRFIKVVVDEELIPYAGYTYIYDRLSKNFDEEVRNFECINEIPEIVVIGDDYILFSFF